MSDPCFQPNTWHSGIGEPGGSRRDSRVPEKVAPDSFLDAGFLDCSLEPCPRCLVCELSHFEAVRSDPERCLRILPVGIVVQQQRQPGTQSAYPDNVLADLAIHSELSSQRIE